MYKYMIKRLIDILFSGVALILLMPLLLIISLLLCLRQGRPVFFKQQRVGKDEKLFNIYKFRTMNDKKDQNGNPLADEERVTRLGIFLRSSSLDELPELWSILKGDLSLVGPRPLIPAYLPYYTKFERERHRVRAGLIPPEVLYANPFPTWEEQLGYEAEYTYQVSFLLDVKILFSTVRCVLRRHRQGYGHYVRPGLIEERRKNDTLPDLPID